MKAYILRRTLRGVFGNTREQTVYFDGKRWNANQDEAVRFARPEDAKRCIPNAVMPTEVIEVGL